ncbi:MAG TPA: hypothetical protein VKB93_21880 [Thermoanaerobaculia bacterium]|nr:hypothetical protein [Thermoanaerobaculia bacterium]
MTNPETITFLVEATAKGPGGLKTIEVPVEKLKASFAQATAQLSAVFEHIVDVGRFELQQVEIGVEIGASGGVEFIGTATASGKAAIKLTFKPNKPGGNNA